MSDALSIAFDLDVRDKDLCVSLDNKLAHSLTSVDDIKDIYFYLRCGDLYRIMPSTKQKINSLLEKELSNEVDWDLFNRVQYWLDDNIRTYLLDLWLHGSELKATSTWIVRNIPTTHKEIVTILSRFVDIYKSKRTQANLETIESIFSNIPSEKLKEACEVVKKATPAIASILLTREVEDEYTLAGLKAVSKLSKQKNINIKIDFDMLKHLGPRARLDAMKQLTGIMSKWGRTHKNLPFKSIPEKKDVELFLFPCSIKYNQEVIELVEHFCNLK